MASNRVYFYNVVFKQAFTNKTMLRNCFIIALLVGFAPSLWAQTEHTALLEGSQAYQAGNFKTAIDYFQKALDKNTSLKGHYNLGNALYKNKEYETAIQHFQRAAEQTEDSQQKSKALYNLGNSYLAQAQGQEKPNKESKEQLESAIGAYKSALRNNPKDFEAKNNLATAYKLLRQQQPPPPQKDQQNQDQQDQKDQQEQNKDQKENPSENSDQSQEQQEGKEEQQPPQNPNEEKPIDNTNEPQPKNATPQEMSKAEAKRLLEVVAEGDKDVQERLMQRQQQQQPRKGDKTW